MKRTLARIGWGTAGAVVLVVGLFGVGTAGAQASSSGSKSSSATSSSTGSKTNPASGGSLQGYASDSALEDGTIVQLTTGSANKVQPATAKNMAQMYGVTVDPHTLQVTVNDASLPNEAFVATSGTYNALVSTQNGVIKSGDYVTISAIDGVAMKAGTYDDQKTVFGRAAGNFDGKSNVLDSESLKNTNGSGAGTVQIGMIPVAINIERNPNDRSTKTNLPPWLQQVGKAIAQKPVSPIRMYLSIGITGLSIIVALVTLNSGVRNAFISIGRNPLSKKAIFRALLEVILSGALILIIGLFAVYLLLKL